MAEIVLINPRFEVSFWGMEHIRFLGRRSRLPVACLPLLAALTPDVHSVTLVDENVEEIDYRRCARADIVGLTGMSVQRFRMREILTELKRWGAFTVVGGPWVTVQEDYFEGLADVVFIGEAEETWPLFLAEWQQGRHRRRYEQVEKTDMTRVPTPRFDLLKMRYYSCGSVQFSRGCPFQCEFCDIIVTFGRRPRLKTGTQILAELEALRAQGMSNVFIVDDNLIGNKRAIKPLLRDLIAYQRRRGYPFHFLTEASLDLAEDGELMQLMVDCGINTVFIGVESPNEHALREAKKLQNVRPVGSLAERIHRIQEAGLEVWCGMIVGFDSDDPAIFAAQQRFLDEARIATAMVGMLSAIPKTPLHARLAREGRLDPSDTPECGTNVIPQRLSRQALRDGYVKLLNDLYAPASYFRRLEALYLRGRFDYGRGRAAYLRRHRWAWLKDQVTNLVVAMVLFGRLMRGVPEAPLRQEYRRRLVRLWKSRPSPTLLLLYIYRCAMHYHQHLMARQMAIGQGPCNTL